MRIIFLILCFWVPILCISQDDKPPTQKEIEAQKQEAVNEAKQQLGELKKDIAEAKAKKEDPESIREMEKQLTTLENMVAMLEKTNLSSKPRSETQSPVKIVEPKFVSPFTPIGLKQPVSIPTEKEATDQLFWYKGKKINANILITTSGTIVQYDPKNHKLIYEPSHNPVPDTTHSYYGFVYTLKQTRQMKNLFVSQIDGMMNSFFMYPQIQAAYEEFDLMSNRFYDLADNTHNIQRPTAYVAGDVNKMIKNLDDYVKNLPGIKKIILPPKRPVGNCLCEVPDEVVKYEIELEKWLPNFFEEELEIIGKLVDIFDEISYSPGPNPHKKYDFNYEQYLVTAFIRANYKVEELLKEYEADLENIVLEDGLVYAVRNLAHLAKEYDLKSVSNVQNGIYSKSEDLYKQVKDAVFSQKFDDYILFKKSFKEFNVVFDHQLYVSHEYNKRLLSPGYKVNDNIKKWLESMEDFNRFTLSINIEFEYEQIPDGTKPMMTANGEFQSDKIFVSLGIEDCMLNLRVTDANYRDRNGDEEKLKIPLKVIKGSKVYDRQASIPYTGPGTVGMLFPRFKLSFCGDPSEIKLDLLTYKPSDIQKHSSDNAAKVYTIDMLAYANKMFVGLVKTHSNLNELNKIAGSMMDMNSSSLPASTGNPVLNQMQMDYQMNKKRYGLQYDLAAATHTEKTIIKLGVLDPKGSPVIGPNPVDIVDQFDKDKAIRITYAYITLILTHTPL